MSVYNREIVFPCCLFRGIFFQFRSSFFLWTFFFRDTSDSIQFSFGFFYPIQLVFNIFFLLFLIIMIRLSIASMVLKTRWYTKQKHNLSYLRCVYNHFLVVSGTFAFVAIINGYDSYHSIDLYIVLRIKNIFSLQFFLSIFFCFASGSWYTPFWLYLDISTDVYIWWKWDELQHFYNGFRYEIHLFSLVFIVFSTGIKVAENSVMLERRFYELSFALVRCFCNFTIMSVAFFEKEQRKKK